MGNSQWSKSSFGNCRLAALGALSGLIPGLVAFCYGDLTNNPWGSRLLLVSKLVLVLVSAAMVKVAMRPNVLRNVVARPRPLVRALARMAMGAESSAL